MNLTKTVNKVVTNKYVLYVMLFLAITQVLAYLGTQNFDALVMFAASGFLATYFTKNMVIVLLTAIMTANFLHLSFHIEGMKNKGSKNEDHKEDDEDEEDEDEEEDKPVNSVNHEKTIEESYGNLHKMLGSENFKKMSKDTKNLMDKQTQLAGTLESMGPILENAQGMLKKFDLDKMSGLLNKFSTKKDEEKN
jgi:hypothetical protein